MTAAPKRNEDSSPLGEEILAILTKLDRQNKLTASAILKEGKDPRSPLHGKFNWNDKTAAHAYRMDQARSLITEFKIEIVVQKRVIVVPIFQEAANKESPQEEGYQATLDIRKNKSDSRAKVVRHLKTALSSLNNALVLCDILGLEEDVERIIRAVERVQNKLQD